MSNLAFFSACFPKQICCPPSPDCPKLFPKQVYWFGVGYLRHLTLQPLMVSMNIPINGSTCISTLITYLLFSVRKTAWVTIWFTTELFNVAHLSEMLFSLTNVAFFIICRALSSLMFITTAKEGAKDLNMLL